MRWLAVILFVTLAACTTKMDKAGRTESTVDPRYLLKSEVDRIARKMLGFARAADGAVMALAAARRAPTPSRKRKPATRTRSKA